MVPNQVLFAKDSSLIVAYWHRQKKGNNIYRKLIGSELKGANQGTGTRRDKGYDSLPEGVPEGEGQGRS